MHGTFVASYQAVFAGGIGVQLTWSRPPKTTLFSVLRSIASSNACRSFALDASGVPTFVYGRLPTPFLLPMLMMMPDQPSWRRLDHPQARGLPDAVELGRRDLVEHLDVARLQRRRRRGRVGHRLEDDLVEVDVLLVVVVGRLDHGDVVADDAVVEHERADADRIRREVVAELGQLRRRQDVRVLPVNVESRAFRW